MNVISAVVQGCHHMGILQFFALYLYNEGLSSYKNFYCSFIDYFYVRPETVAGKAIRHIEAQLDEVLAEKGTLSICDSRFGKILWTFEEYLFLSLTYEADEFYAQAEDFLRSFGIDGDIYNNLLRFQRGITKQPFDENVEIELSYAFLDYFRKIIDGENEITNFVGDSYYVRNLNEDRTVEVIFEQEAIPELLGDVNLDEKVNIKDATAIQKYVAKIETGLPIGKPVE